MQGLYKLGAFYSSTFWLLSRIRPIPPWLPSLSRLALEHSVSSVSDTRCLFCSWITDSVPWAAAFNSSFGHSDFVEFIPTSVEGHTSRSPHPSTAVRALKDSTQKGDTSKRVILISANGDPDLDIEAYESPSSSPGATRTYSMILFDRHHEETLPPQPYQVSTQTPPGTKPEPGNPLRRDKILSFSNSVWATFGAPEDKKSRASIYSETSIDNMGSPTSNDHFHERSTKFLSATSTILGSDIIRRTTLNKNKDRMRIRYSIPNHSLSPTPSAPSSWRRAVHYSWLSRAPANSTTFEDTSQERSTRSKGGLPPSPRSASLQSSKSKHGSKSSRTSKYRKSCSNSTLSAKISAEEDSSVPVWTGSSMDRTSLTKPPPSLSRDSTGFVRGPHPPSPF